MARRNTLARKLPETTEIPEVQGEQEPTRVDLAAIAQRVGNVVIENWALGEALDKERRKNAALVQANLALQEQLAKSKAP